MLSLPGPVLLERDPFEIAHVDVVKERLDLDRDVPASKRDLRGLPRARETGADAGVEANVGDLLAQQPRLVSSLLREGDGNRWVAVDPVLGVQGRFPMPGEHVKLHEPQAIQASACGCRSRGVAALPRLRLPPTMYGGPQA